MISRLIDAAPIWGSTAAPAIVLLALGVLLRGKPAPRVCPRPVVRCDCCPKHRTGVPVSRTVRRMAQEWARRPRPVGYASPLFTVPREAVTR